jgi:membrane protease YdiL (CAAX protease family)
MHKSSLLHKPVLEFFLLVFVLSVPFWLVDILAQPPNGITINLPVSSLMAFNPLVATTLILTYRCKKYAAIKKLKELVKRAFDYRRIKCKRWYIPIIFLAPAMLFLAYWVTYFTGVSLPKPDTPILLVAILFPLFFISALGEEVGWLGYAIDPMQHRWGCTKSKHNPRNNMGDVAPLGIYSTQQRGRMGIMAVSWFDTFTNPYRLAL